MTKFLTKPLTLWILFALFILETIGFAAIMAVWDFEVIDEISDPEKVRHHIAEMSALQRTVHAWTTATLDVAYPLTYGPLFAGFALRALKPIFAVPAIAVIPTDLTEGVVQVLALTGSGDLIWLKAYLTPLKLVLFLIAMMIAVGALGVMFLRRKQSKTDTLEDG